MASSVNNTLSALTCQVVDSKNTIESILQRITPIEFIPALTFSSADITQLGSSIGSLTGPSLGTLTVQSKIETLDIESYSGYIHELAVDILTIAGITGIYTGPTGPTGYTGLPGTAANTGATGPTGVLPTVPIDFLSPSQATLSTSDTSAAVIRNNVSFAPGIPTDGFSKTIINGYTGNNLLSPLTTSMTSTLNGFVNAMEKVGNTIYIGGAFTGSCDGLTRYPFIAKWDDVNGLQQVNGPNGPNNVVNTLAYDSTSNILYVGGTFTQWGAIATSPNYIGKWNIGSQTFSTLGTAGLPSGVIPSSPSSCLSLYMDNTAGKLYTGWNTFTRNNLFSYQSNTWSGFTGPISSVPKKLLVDNANNVVYVGYDGSSTPINQFTSLYTINPTTRANTIVYATSGSPNITATMDNTNKVYIGQKTPVIGNLPFGGASYMGTYVNGNSSITPFQQVQTPINYLNYDNSNNLLYMCANTLNASLSTIINQQTYQSIQSYNGTSIKNVADVDVYINGILTPASNSQILVAPFNNNGAPTYSRQPSKTSQTNQVYIHNCGRINKNASLTITAPINYYNGNTGSSYTLYSVGDKVEMKWDTTTSSWWV